MSGPWIQYRPDSSPYSSRITNEQWEEHRGFLKELHYAEVTRQSMLIMLENRNFRPSLGQLNAKMKEWGFRRYHGHIRQRENSSQSSFPESNSNTSTSDTFTDGQHESSRNHPSHQASLPQPVEWDDIPRLEATLRWEVQKMIALCESSPWSDPSEQNSRSSQFSGNFITDADIPTLGAIADFLYAARYYPDAFFANLMILKHIASTTSPSAPMFAQYLLKCGMSTSAYQKTKLRPVLERARLYYSTAGYAGMASCLIVLLEEDGVRQSGLHRDLPALFLVDVTLENMKSFERREAYRKVFEQLELCDSCHTVIPSLCSHSLQSLPASAFQECEKLMSQRMNSTEAMSQVLERLYQRFIYSFTRAYPKSQVPVAEQYAEQSGRSSSLCPFRTIFSPLLSLVLIARFIIDESIPKLAQVDRRHMWCADTEFGEVREGLAALGAISPSLRCRAFFHTYLRHFTTTAKQRVERYNAVPECFDAVGTANVLAERMMAEGAYHAGCSPARPNYHLINLPESPSENNYMRLLNEDEYLDHYHHPTMDATASSPSDVTIHRFRFLAKTLKLKTTLGLSSRSPSTSGPRDSIRSSWSFHQVTGMPRDSIMSGSSRSGPLSRQSSMANDRPELPAPHVRRHATSMSMGSDRMDVDSRTNSQHYSFAM